MPNNMGRLKHLQILTGFYVGRHNGSNLKELGKLIYLRGSLEVSKLENVNDPIVAREACMKDKKHLYKLGLQWNGNNEDSQNERFTLEGLQPHVNLKELTIRNYGGTRFADWFDDPYLPNLVSLVLRACKYCFCLPSLGQLPSLRSVHIAKLEGIKKIGLNFYGNNNLSWAPFPSLVNLFIAEMMEWEEWMHFEGECFPCLKEIVIRYCPRLRKSLPPHLPCLEKLQIEQCGDLELESFPTKAFSTPKLESIHLSGLTHLKSLHEDMRTLLPYVHSLSLFCCPQLQLVPQEGLPLSLVQISIHNCSKLFASRMNWGLSRLHSLQKFSIGENFENVESFPEEGLLPPNLKVLRFEGCSDLFGPSSALQHESKKGGPIIFHLTENKKLPISDKDIVTIASSLWSPSCLEFGWSYCTVAFILSLKEDDITWHKSSKFPLLPFMVFSLISIRVPFPVAGKEVCLQTGPSSTGGYQMKRICDDPSGKPAVGNLH
ncbi:putative disease resistance protein At3g14460 [Neltuma alba]|uniref:putative disease resistance protein At3g14460 n=1 Tax=Neltuma alba TaxID=207710 RepID=UPI0010A4BC52|nr:putative disease resistance protein At3g14460 [Prosopis alba]